MAEDDWEGWVNLTKELGKNIQLVGDDLFVTNIKRLKIGIEKNAGNSILVKVKSNRNIKRNTRYYLPSKTEINFLL